MRKQGSGGYNGFNSILEKRRTRGRNEAEIKGASTRPHGRISDSTLAFSSLFPFHGDRSQRENPGVLLPLISPVAAPCRPFLRPSRRALGSNRICEGQQEAENKRGKER